MKYITTIFILFSLASVSYGWEISENPDRYLSIAIGVNIGELSGSGDVSYYRFDYPSVYAFGVGEAISESGVKSIMPSIRFPITKNLSLDLWGNYMDIESEFSFSQSGNSHESWGLNNNLRGVIWGAEARWYLK